ncbi:Uncharacterized protein HZ326_27014 [Fusarium oxysporum f. sp. albedinis]|nr:Uncharacterized protein HZ326_27014 [Fusarium oxysporum f. sp. albedinis]
MYSRGRPTKQVPWNIAPRRGGQSCPFVLRRPSVRASTKMVGWPDRPSLSSFAYSLTTTPLLRRSGRLKTRFHSSLIPSA